MYADAPYLIRVSVSANGYIGTTQTFQIGGKPTDSFNELGQFILFRTSLNFESSFNDRNLDAIDDTTNLLNKEIIADDESTISYIVEPLLPINDEIDPQPSYEVDNYIPVRQIQSTILSTVYVNPYDASTYNEVGGPQLIKTAFVELYRGSDYSVIGEQKPYMTASSQPGFFFLNVPTGNYIIHVSGNGLYADYWRIATIWQGSQTLDLPISPLSFSSSVGSNLRVTLEWSDNTQDLDLYGTFNIDPVSDCVVDGISYNCQGLRSHNDQYLSSVIEVDTLGPYYYLFFVKKFIYANDTTTSSGDYIIQSGATIKVYVPGFSGATYQFNIPAQTFADNPVSLSDNMVWLGFCMDGNVGPLSITPIADYWNGALSTGAGGVPNSNICQNYLIPANYGNPGSSEGQ
jgi:hypothetical protein